MEDQAIEAVDPLKRAASLIANSPDESEDLEEEDKDEATEATDEEDNPDAEPSDEEEEGATESPKREVLFAGQKFELPADLPDEVAQKVEEVGRNLQGDYTRKTQELVSREKEAAAFFQRELDAGRQHVQQAIQQAHALIQATGGFMDPSQLAALAETDPQAWIQANARQQQLQTYLGQLQQRQQALEQQAQQAEAQRIEAAKREAWQRLDAEGVTREGLAKLWNDAKTAFPFLDDQKLSAVLDAESWLVLRDAVAFRQLKAQKPQVAKKAAEAPKVPETKRPMSKDDRARLDARKAVQRRGGANLRALAAFIETNT